MDELIGDEHLNLEERWVRRRLERALGPTRVTDWNGGPEGQHDLEADLPEGGIAAIEITREADGARLRAAARAKRYLSDVKVPGSQFKWLVHVAPQADAGALGKADGLVALLIDIEQHGQSSVTTLCDYRNPWREQLEVLGIESVHGFAGSSDRLGAVIVAPGMVFAWGWVRVNADKWITGFLASELGKRKLAKLARADASERHLVVVLDPDTDAGIGIAAALADMHEATAGDDLPSVVPPLPLTHMWLMPPMFTTRAFRWARGSGWAVVDP